MPSITPPIAPHGAAYPSFSPAAAIPATASAISPDSRPVYRKIMPFAMADYAEHLQRLTPEDRYARFTGAVSAEVMIRHCQKLDWNKSRVLGAFVEGTLRGAAEISFHSAFWPEAAELALSVESAFQNQGIGRELVRRAMVLARNRGVRHVHLLCLRENRRMLALARAYHGAIELEGRDASSAIALDRPDQVSFLLEALDDSAGAFASWIESLHPFPALRQAFPGAGKPSQPV